MRTGFEDGSPGQEEVPARADQVLLCVHGGLVAGLHEVRAEVAEIAGVDEGGEGTPEPEEQPGAAVGAAELDTWLLQLNPVERKQSVNYEVSMSPLRLCHEGRRQPGVRRRGRRQREQVDRPSGHREGVKEVG